MRVAVFGLSIFFLLQSCTNISQKLGRSTTGNPAIFTGTDFTSVAFTHQLSNVTAPAVPSATAGAASTQINLTLALNTTIAGYQPISNFCSLGTNPCACEMKWQQTNSAGEFLYNRSRRIPVTTVQSGLVSCLVSTSDWNEIPQGSILTLRIIPTGVNASGLNCKTINYRKGGSNTPIGDFIDDSLTAFRNIHRYSCHSKRTGPHEILNRFQNISRTPPDDPAGGGADPGAPVRTSVGSCFCTSGNSGGNAGNAGGGAGGGGGVCASLQCPQNGRSGYSAQNYYRNFYVQSDDLGTINSSNGTYDCPKVLESVKTSATSSTGLTTVPQSEQGKYWPLDSSFALARDPSPEWSIPIRAASVLSDGSTPPQCAAGDLACLCAGADPTFVENGVLTKCLGFAKPAKPDGTCGTLTDSGGNVRPLVRLRRYRAVLPARFAPNGDLEGASAASGGGGGGSGIFPASDEVYVADRMVLDQNALPTGDMIYGPKPCNYAWFDHEGVVDRGSIANDFVTNVYTGALYGRPGYVGTNRFYRNPTFNPNWDPSLSVNPDALIFPNHDRLGGGVESPNQAFCSASLPVVNYSQGQASTISLFTSNSNRTGASLTLGSYAVGSKLVLLDEIHLRPIDPWVPQYLEDTSFKACVPQSSQYTEPPLHFYKDTNNNYAWCAEVYPSQNPYWAEINKKRRIITPTASTNIDQIYTNNLVSYPNPGASPPVAGYTSHVNSNFAGQNACTATPGPQVCAMTTTLGSLTNTNCQTYLGRATDSTCDRTTMFDPFKNYRDFPLLANASDTERMLGHDLANLKSYACTYSVSADPAKVNRQYPSTACCGIKNGTAVLSTLISGPGGTGAHVEPMTDASAPEFRYCGTPVR